MCAFFKYFFKWLPQNWAAMLIQMGKRLLKAGQLSTRIVLETISL